MLGRDAAGRHGPDSAIDSMRLEDDGRTYRIAATTSAEEIGVAERIPPSGDPVVDRWIDALQEGDEDRARAVQQAFARSPEGERLWAEAVAGPREQAAEVQQQRQEQQARGMAM